MSEPGKNTTDLAEPRPHRVMEATAAFLRGLPQGYDLPPLELIVKQMEKALEAADRA